MTVRLPLEEGRSSAESPSRVGRRSLLAAAGALAAAGVAVSSAPALAAARTVVSGPATATGLPPATAHGLYVEKDGPARLLIWQRANPGQRWIRYDVRRFTVPAKRLDAWRVQGIAALRPDTSAPSPGGAEAPSIELTTPANYEYAFKLAGQQSHLGGMHGHELLRSFLMVADGRVVPVADPGALTAFDTFELAQDTELFDPLSDPPTPIGDLHVRHVFTAGGFGLRWRLDWRAERSVSFAYGAMLPAIRAADVTTRMRYLDRAREYDIAAEGHDAPSADSYGVQMYNTTNGASLSVELGPEFFGGYTRSAGRGLWVYDGAKYNKVYPTRVFDPHQEPVTPGDAWHLEATYRFRFPA